MARPEHQPTDALRTRVRDLVSFKASQAQLAAYLGIDAKTLRKHYREEIDAGVCDLVLEAGNTVRRAVKSGDLDAAKFTLARAGNWGPTSSVSVSSDDLKVSIQETYGGVITENNKNNLDKSFVEDLENSTGVETVLLGERDNE